MAVFKYRIQSPYAARPALRRCFFSAVKCAKEIAAAVKRRGDDRNVVVTETNTGRTWEITTESDAIDLWAGRLPDTAGKAD